MSGRQLTARLIARDQQVDLTAADLDTTLDLVDAECNRLTQRRAWLAATDAQRRKLESLRQRLILIREQLG